VIFMEESSSSAPDEPPASRGSSRSPLGRGGSRRGSNRDIRSSPRASPTTDPPPVALTTAPLPALDRKHPLLKGVSKAHIDAIWAMRVESTDVSWDDVVGVDSIRQRIDENVVLRLQRPDLFKGITKKASKGMLLFGPPGTGKTMVAKAVAAEVKFHFFNVNCSGMESKWHGEAEKLIEALFKVAKAAQPGSIIFLDECDSLLGESGSGDDAAHNNKIVNQFKASWDGVEQAGEKGNVFVIGATNHPWKLDTAITRPGRMDFKMLVPLPNRNARRRILHRKLQENVWDQAGCEALVLDNTGGFSGADLDVLCQEAAMGPVREARKQPVGTPLRAITPADFTRALERTPRSVGDDIVHIHAEWAKEHATAA